MKYVRAESVEELLNFVDGVIAHIYDAPISITHETKEEAYEHGVFSGTRDGKYTAYTSMQGSLKQILSSARSFKFPAAHLGGRKIGKWVNDEYCSECGTPAVEEDYPVLTPYCPWCGAIMCNAEISEDDDDDE